MTAALEGGEWSAVRPDRTLPLEKGETRYSFYRRLGGPRFRSGRAENLVPVGIRSRTVQPVVSRYTNWATRPNLFIIIIIIIIISSSSSSSSSSSIRSNIRSSSSSSSSSSSKMLRLEHSFLWFWNLDIGAGRSEIPGKFRNMVFE